VHGIGQYSWQDNRCYCGQYEFDRKHGFGVFIWADGGKYEGIWKRGKQHGIGRYTDKHGDGWTSMWDEGKRIDPSATQWDVKDLSTDNDVHGWDVS